MNDLQVYQATELTIDSREVAEMMGMKHYQILEKLEGTNTVKGIMPILTHHNFMVSDYFIESSYIDGSGKQNKCYLCTKMGCEFLANKFTGEKGIIFTAKYVDRFNKMEQEIQGNKLFITGASKELQAIFVLDKKQQHFDNRLTSLENNMTIDFGQQRNLQVLAQKRAIEEIGGKDTPAYSDKPVRTKVFQAIWKDYKDYFQVASYRDTLKAQYERAVEFLNDWRLTGKLLREVEEFNDQLVMNIQSEA